MARSTHLKLYLVRHIKPRLLLAALGLLALVTPFLFPAAAYAHANIEGSDPPASAVLQSSPRGLRLRFSEPVAPKFSSIQVLDSQARRVDNGDSTVPADDPAAMTVSVPDLARGTYTVAWRTLSNVDGHTVQGSFLFSIGEPISGAAQGPQPSQPLLQSKADPFLRWGVLLGMLAIFGGLAFQLLIAGPALQGHTHLRPLARISQRMLGRSRALVWVSIAFLAAVSVAHLLVQAGSARQVSWYRAFGEPVKSVLLNTDFGNYWLWRIGLLTLVAALLLLAPRLGRSSEARLKATRWLALGAAAAMLVTNSLASHAGAVTGIRGSALLGDFIHLLAAGAWVGGLFHFAAAVPTVLASPDHRARRIALVETVSRFSILATVSVVALIASGVYNSWVEVNTVSASTTPYGLALVAKVAVIAPLLALGALNLLWTSKRLLASKSAAGLLRAFVTGEAVLAVLVVLAVGWMTGLEPARQTHQREEATQARAVDLQQKLQEGTVRLKVDPGGIGPNTFTLEVADSGGRPIGNATDTRLTLSNLSIDLGRQAVVLITHGGGLYHGQSSGISVAGLWQAEVLVVRPDGFDLRAAFRFNVGALAQGRAANALDPGASNVFLGVVLAVIGVALFGAGMTLGGLTTRTGAATLTPAAVAVIAGLVFLFSRGAAVQEIKEVANPVPPTETSIAAGKEVYTRSCAACHGPQGLGDGPSAAGLKPPPFNLKVHVPLHSDSTLFGYVSNGFPNTSMAAYGKILSSDDIWNVVNYLRTLAPQPVSGTPTPPADATPASGK